MEYFEHYYFSMFSADYHPHIKTPFFKRLKLAWDVLFKDEMFEDQISLDKDAMKDFVRKSANMVGMKVIDKKIND